MPEQSETVVQIIFTVQGTPKTVGEILDRVVRKIDDEPTTEIQAYSSIRYAEQQQPHFFMNGPN